MRSLGSSPAGSEDLSSEDGSPSVRSLVDQAAGGGMDIELRIDGTAEDDDPAVAITIYRIVQEALTNANRHARGARTRVHVRFAPEGVEIDVADSGPTTPPVGAIVSGSGQGLLGLQERVVLFGGEMTAGPTREGGLLLATWLPRGRARA